LIIKKLSPCGRCPEGTKIDCLPFGRSPVGRKIACPVAS